MTILVRKWGNSLAVRIPTVLAKELHLAEGVELEITRKDGGLLLRRRKRAFTLKELLAGITPQNIHGETEWGSAPGREAW